LSITLSPSILDQADEAVRAGRAKNRSELIELALRHYLSADADDDEKHRLHVSWTVYYRWLCAQEEQTSRNNDDIHVFDTERSSYRLEIQTCRDLLDSAGSFSALGVEARDVIAGIGAGTTGFLGRMDRSPPFMHAVRHAWATIAAQLDSLPVRGPVPAKTERACLQGLLGISGVGIGGATRLMAVARPDLYFTVNGASYEGIEELLGPTHKDSTAHRAKAYLERLAEVRSFPWFNEPKPAATTDEQERFAWSARTALLDALFYAKAPDLA
jgi:Arc/MetJ-type ribon-helix-helix transcriptional regulator